MERIVEEMIEAGKRTYLAGRVDGSLEEREAVVRAISEDQRLQGWRLEPAVESYRRLLLDILHAGEHRKEA